ncbi:MAG: hypothetical protein QXG16_03330 [Candidatus Anstonellaceae archaeon]
MAKYRGGFIVGLGLGILVGGASLFLKNSLTTTGSQIEKKVKTTTFTSHKPQPEKHILSSQSLFIIKKGKLKQQIQLNKENIYSDHGLTYKIKGGEIQKKQAKLSEDPTNIYQEQGITSKVQSKIGQNKKTVKKAKDVSPSTKTSPSYFAKENNIQQQTSKFQTEKQQQQEQLPKFQTETEKQIFQTLGPEGLEVYRLVDGKRSVKDIQNIMQDLYNVSPAETYNLIEKLFDMGYIEFTIADDKGSQEQPSSKRKKVYIINLK